MSENIKTYSRDWTVETIYNQIKQGNIDLNPKFNLIFLEIRSRIENFGKIKSSEKSEKFVGKEKRKEGLKFEKTNSFKERKKNSENTVLEYLDGVTDRQTPWFILHLVLEDDGQTDNIKINSRKINKSSDNDNSN